MIESKFIVKIVQQSNTSAGEQKRIMSSEHTEGLKY